MTHAAKLTDPEWNAFSAWLETLRYGPELVCPARYLWASYLRFCREDGFPLAGPKQFMIWLGALDGVKVHTAGRGRIRRMVEGCAP